MTSGREGANPADDLRRLFAEKLMPEVVTVNARRRKALWLSIAAAAAVFVVLVLATALMLGQYARFMREHDQTIWPLYVLFPLTMAILAFSIVHVLILRSAVSDFRAAVLGRVAEFVDPALAVEAGRRVSPETVERSLLFPAGAKAKPGEDRFHGRTAAGSAYELCEFNSADGAGVFMAATLPGRDSAFGRAVAGARRLQSDLGVNRITRLSASARGWRLGMSGVIW